jgi:hypothetical protein
VPRRLLERTVALPLERRPAGYGFRLPEGRRIATTIAARGPNRYGRTCGRLTAAWSNLNISPVRRRRRLGTDP